MHTPDYTSARKAMVDNQVATSSVTDPRLLSTLRRVPRELFLPADRHALAYSDAHHPLGQGRFLVAPAVFARLVQLTEVSETDRVLDYWPSTGYSTAVLSALARDVVGFEPDPALAAEARIRMAELGISNAVITQQLAPGDLFDVVLVEGAVAEIPADLLQKLAPGGRLVCLVRNGPVGVATVCLRGVTGIVTKTWFNATLPVIDLQPVPERFVF
ncbi:protein-L-isoaspartate O-methyltransferase family protein [Devosia sediminis]|uniref:Protein-L-isoaspartate O-methyltransferase n=1 Tax=Devosia sediminis TaxID=2798801 RepID=A0A934J0D7_9HYPH|nr:protein-L-isoaspartate O-methyltransferase [Devosia sediminis]MBJ3785547.1 protein-L-isoaspartate O-methyltransferase [Devosia sediminis]